MSSSWGSNSRSSNSSGSDVENPFNVEEEELLQIGTRCSELRKEKDLLRESQSQSVELVRRLELNANSLSESRLEDERRIQTMEKEIEKLEESITSLTLESQCEIESMKLDIVALEQALFDAKKVQGVSIQESDKLREIVEELQLKSHEAQEYAKCLEKQNEELRERFAASERIVEEDFFRSFKERLPSKSEAPVNAEECFLEIVESLEASQNVNLRDKMARKIRQYEDLVKQLKDELKEEKLKAKEEAEDLTQEMAELRYNMTCLLEEEYKRRACIEHASLQRIADLETQIKREKHKSSTCIRN